MLHRKFIYTALAVLLVAGLAGAFALYQMLGRSSIAHYDNTDRSREGTPVAEEASKPSSSELNSNKDSDEQQEINSFVDNIMRRPVNRPSFGSFRLKSVIVNDAAPGKSRAIIESLDSGSSRTYSINDILPDNSRLEDIKQDYVVLEKNGIRKRIFFASGIGSSTGSSNPGAAGYTKIGDNEFNLNPYRVFRGDADRVLDFSLKIKSSDGDMEGIQVNGIQKGTLADRLGLKEGDVLLEVNGQKIDSILNTVRAGMNAHSSDDLSLKIRRNDQVVTLTYHLFWQGQGSWTSTDILNSKAISSLFNEASLFNLF